MCPIYIYYNSSTFSGFPCLRSSVLLQHLALLHYHPLRNLGLQLHVTLITRPDSVLYNGACKCFAHEIKVKMRVRVRLCGNACLVQNEWELAALQHVQATLRVTPPMSPCPTPSTDAEPVRKHAETIFSVHCAAWRQQKLTLGIKMVKCFAMAHKPLITAGFVTVCCSINTVSKTLCSHLFGQ